MFIDALKSDLLNIFKVKKVLIAPLEYGAEQEIIYCEIDKVVNDIKDGYAYSQVSAEVAIVAVAEKLMRGWIHKQIATMPKEIHQKFDFSSIEDAIPFPSDEKLLTKYSVSFTYYFVGEYDPKKKMKGVKYKEEA
ncbi:MAG: hypothetical protein LBT79_03615 [Elusimicrobiota bacterium]|jgi:Tfp pilus assembly PilM family ATPase|nr:hypothetical protein [Elusimicrobiota bacterium]